MFLAIRIVCRLHPQTNSILHNDTDTILITKLRQKYAKKDAKTCTL